MARDEVWDALKNHAKQVHSERVAKNPDRIAYAIQQFEAHGIEYQLKNEQTGHFHCWRKSDDTMIPASIPSLLRRFLRLKTDRRFFIIKSSTNSA